MPRPTAEWLTAPGVIDSLKAAWAAGTPTVEMGRLFGTTKSAIIGMVHRLGLDPRKSPISYTGVPRPAPRPYVPPRTLPPLESEPARAAPGPVIAAPTPIAAPIAAPRPTFTRAAECCWPSGEPGTKTFRYCGANSLPGKPYCDEHAKLAFVKVRDRRDDAGQRTVAMGAD